MSTTSHLSIVNTAPDSILLGHGLVAIAIAQAENRPGLRGTIESFQFDRERGVGLRVTNAGTRQHLANALGLDREVTSRMTPEGMVFVRTGIHLGVPVSVWNLEP